MGLTLIIRHKLKIKEEYNMNNVKNKACYIVGFDGETQSEKASTLAVESLKNSGGGKLILLYIVDWSDFGVLSVEELTMRHEQKLNEVKEAKDNILESEKTRLEEMFKGANIEFKLIVKMGSASEVICDVADKENADHIFIGHRTSGILTGFGLGSVAYGVLQKSKTPVTVFP